MHSFRQLNNRTCEANYCLFGWARTPSWLSWWTQPVYIPCWVPKHGADQLAQVLTDTSSAPRCCPITFQDFYHNTSAKKTPQLHLSITTPPPAALTPIVMKCFERLVKAHIISKGPSTPPITTTTPATKAKHWNTQCRASDWETVQRVVRTAEKKNHFTLSRTLLGVRPSPHVHIRDCSNYCPLARGSTASGAEQPDSVTVSFPRAFWTLNNPHHYSF